MSNPNPFYNRGIAIGPGASADADGIAIGRARANAGEVVINGPIYITTCKCGKTVQKNGEVLRHVNDNTICK